MEYRRLGKSGLYVSSIGLGTNNFGKRVDYKGTKDIIDKALTCGINFFDTANAYSNGDSERYIGDALKGKRNADVIATKVSSPMAEGPNQAGNSRRHIIQEVEASLNRLRTDYIDLYQIHWWDPHTPIEETLRALNDLIHQGKVRYIGCSNFNAWQVCESYWTAKSLGLSSFISTQPRYNLLDREIESELLPLCYKYNIGILPYYPLANGFLTGKFKRGQSPIVGTRLEEDHRGMFTNENFDLIEKLTDFALKRNHTLLDLAFSWLLSDLSVASVIAGARNVQQVVTNAKTGDWILSEDDKKEIANLLN